MTDQPKIFPLGDNAVTIDFGNEISVALNDRAVSLAAFLDANPFPGLVEAVPAYSSVAVFYDLTKMDHESLPTVFDAVRSHIDAAFARQFQLPQTNLETIEIPVDFGDDAALDMGFLCDHSRLSRPEVIDLFTSGIYRVYMLGFLPGFAYLGDVDERIAAPRRDSPRLRVPKGSVGIAGRQTGIYPLESPGGWQIIGRTKVEMFRPDDAVPCAVKPGESVRFVPMD